MEDEDGVVVKWLWLWHAHGHATGLSVCRSTVSGSWLQVAAVCISTHAMHMVHQCKPHHAVPNFPMPPTLKWALLLNNVIEYHIWQKQTVAGRRFTKKSEFEFEN
jgi:hypothetical protein